MKMIMILLILNSIIFTQMTHPMSMGLILLMQTILTCMITGIASKSFWFSYILFLIFIGGMLIIFIYMASLNSNEKFYLKQNNSLNIISLFTIFLIILGILISFTYTENMTNIDTESISYNMIMLKENFMVTSKMYDSPNNQIMIFLILYLFMTLVIVVKISNFTTGPLRISNN